MAKKSLKDAHRAAAPKRNYYWIFGVEEQPADDFAPDEYKANTWVVSFGVSTDRGDLDDHFDGRNHLSVGELKELLETPFAKDKNPPLFEFELSKNWHEARVATRERAELLASEITYIFRSANIQPMDEDPGIYPAKQPGTGIPVAFTPPRNPRP